MSMEKLGYAATCLLGSCLLFTSCAPAQDAKNETKLTLTSLPAPVRKTAEEQRKGAQIRSIEKELHEGNSVYEVAMTVNGRTRDIIIAADGALLIAEQEMTLAELPAPVRATLEENAGKAKILLIESVAQRDSLAYYEAQVSASGERSEIKVSPAGDLIPQERK